MAYHSNGLVTYLNVTARAIPPTKKLAVPDNGGGIGWHETQGWLQVLHIENMKRICDNTAKRQREKTRGDLK
jgi:hypothetical protein